MKYFLIIALASLLSTTAIAQWDSVEIKTTKLSETLYMLEGRGGNIGICAGEDGVFMIDDQFAPLSDTILGAVRQITDQPLKFVFNTHWHGDHTGGNANMNKEGAIIVAHQNVRKRMSTDQFMASFGRKVKAAPKAAWPTITFEKDMNMYFNGENIFAFHLHQGAHTDGDAILYFSKSNVIHTGDTYFKGRYPYIDLSSGGSINGIIAVCDAVLMLCDEDTKIIPGHGSLSNKQELIAYRAVLMTVRDRVLKQKKAGKSLEEVQKMELSKEFDEDYGQGFIPPNKMIKAVYETVLENGGR
jgi:cyclase